MAKKLYEEADIQAIAAAIRAKNGTETTYKASEMAAAVEAIVTGGGSSVTVANVIARNASSSTIQFYCGGSAQALTSGKQFALKTPTETIAVITGTSIKPTSTTGATVLGVNSTYTAIVYSITATNAILTVGSST